MDAVLKHPADAEGWKHFDSEFPEFASDPRNVRLGLASDGFNPFEHMSTTYNLWPMVLIPYNLSPWKCMKESNFFMSLLIPGQRSSDKEIDVYLQPLIDELKRFSYRWSKKRYRACPICMGDKSSFGIRGKIAFVGHRHYLCDNHVWHGSKLYDGSLEYRPPSVVLNGHDILEQVDFLEFSVMSKHPSLKDKNRNSKLDENKYTVEH
ncbi:uncharacterized protein E5676_scaffold1738G00970 [Cucumis melo var. makuwa]|uniref:Transposase n=1 Tax=Cucumis melo var. makuwa TaxID=1194695 RepID=A0A5D3BWG9_CUCMM|nr:uncharacterized protein E5676_scaffold1738G00970 [Cucumis melo var. makuwa]